MINVIRNLVGIVAASAAALLFSGGIQEAFRRLLPAASDRLILGVDIGTYLGFFLLGVSFFLIGLFVRRWIRSRVPLVCLVFPVVGLWLWVQSGFWFMLVCDVEFIAACAMIYSFLLIPLASGVAGYYVEACLGRSRERDL